MLHDVSFVIARYGKAYRGTLRALLLCKRVHTCGPMGGARIYTFSSILAISLQQEYCILRINDPFDFKRIGLSRTSK